MPEIAYLNGEFMPLTEARVSIDDRGFQFGDGVYEALRSYDGRLWAVERHWQRLENSLTALDITGLTIPEVDARVREAFARAGFAEALVYVQVTRGVAPREHAYEAGMTPTFLITVRPFLAHPQEDYERGVAVITLPETRWARRDIKSTNLLPNVLAKVQAKAQGAYEAVFIDRDGLVTEGSSTSLFIVRDGVVLTREPGPHILPGVTQQLVLEIAADLGRPVSRRPFTEEELRTADEAFLTGTGTEVLAITRLDDAPVGTGTPGPVARQLRAAFLKRVARGEDSVG
jgi:D-alanine transaminase